MADVIVAVIYLGLPLVMLVATYFIGSAIERRHYESIQEREAQTRSFPVVSFRDTPADWVVESSGLVAGSVVISLDYFKRFLAGLRAIVGGRIKSYEPLLDRARREAVLRMKEEAIRLGYDSVINLRLETSRLASTYQKGKGVAGVEILAFGTGLRRRPAMEG